MTNTFNDNDAHIETEIHPETRIDIEKDIASASSTKRVVIDLRDRIDGGSRKTLHRQSNQGASHGAVCNVIVYPGKIPPEKRVAVQLKIGDPVRKSPVGAGYINRFTPTGKPVVRTVAVDWLELRDGTVYKFGPK